MSYVPRIGNWNKAEMDEDELKLHLAASAVEDALKSRIRDDGLIAQMTHDDYAAALWAAVGHFLTVLADFDGGQAKA